MAKFQQNELKCNIEWVLMYHVLFHSHSIGPVHFHFLVFFRISMRKTHAHFSIRVFY